MQSVDDLPPYIADVLRAVAAGVQTTRESAERQDIPISNASERFRVARNPGWIHVAETPLAIGHPIRQPQHFSDEQHSGAR